jgi:tetratricopeptide (TPR) repeat protein
MYLGHNYGFLAFSLSMEGAGAAALEAARASSRAVPPEMMDMMPGMDFFIFEPLLVMVRFARWDPLLAEPRPPAKYAVMTALWLHARGMALASKHRLDEAAAMFAELSALKLPADLPAGGNTARELVAVAAKILEARIAEAKQSPDAHALWAEAVKLEDGLAYSEPADWFYPVRHFQGAALLAAGRAAEAEAVFREDLRRNPNNGWSLFGLARALTLQKRDAAEVTKQFEQAWRAADVKLASSTL